MTNPTKLIIAEKPSVAKDIARSLNDKFTDKKTHLEGSEYIVTFALGHLLTIADPQEIDIKYKKWSLNVLPIIPNKFPLKPIEKTQPQLKQVKKLINNKHIKEIINACDSGREGELIFKYILDFASRGKPLDKTISRLWLQSMTQSSIKKSFSTLRKNQEMIPLQNAALSRSEADWLIGINASRGMTGYYSKRGGFFLTPCGRVQTPTLGLIVKREKEITNFISHPYWKLEGHFTTETTSFKATWFKNDFKKGDLKNQEIKSKDDQSDRIWDKAVAAAIIKKTQGKVATFSDKVKPSSESAPLLYDLTTLQREANSLFGFSARQTLRILQTLYEGKKILTYPRTDSKFLPNDYLGTTTGLLKNLQSHAFKGTEKFIEKIFKNQWVAFNKRIFNDAKVSDHHAIIPTGAKIPKLSEIEEKVFLLVLRRYLAVFFPPSKFLKTTRIMVVEGESFKTEGNIITDLGWKEIYHDKIEDKVLPVLGKGESVILDEVTLLDFITKPPARYSEASLLSAMEGAGKMIEDEVLKEAMKERGLGTPATRAAIIEKLIADKYVVKEGRELIPTAKASDLFALIDAMKLNEISSPELTGEWEHKLNLMEKGEIKREEFMEGIIGNAMKIVNNIKEFDIEKLKKPANFSPLNGKKYYEYIDKYISEDNTISLRKVIGGRIISEEEIVTLVTKRKIGPFSDFRSKKSGSLFSASITLDENNKVSFVFANTKDGNEEISLKDAELVGTFYGDGSKVFKTLNHFVSENYGPQNDKAFKLNRIILGKEIETENIQKMLKGEKSNLIKGFRSVKKKRLFDAYLNLTKEGKMVFSFPEKKKKN